MIHEVIKNRIIQWYSKLLQTFLGEPMQNLKIYPYALSSESARMLKAALGGETLRLIKPDGRYAPEDNHTIINWGSAHVPNWAAAAASRRTKILNPVAAVNTASNKLSTLRLLQENGISTPQFTTNQTVAQRWIEDGFTVFERHDLRGNSGDGIRVVNTNAQDARSGVQASITPAPLYTRYLNKESEFRVHVFKRGTSFTTIDFIQKKRRNGFETDTSYSPYVCSASKGWVFVRDGINANSATQTLVKNAAIAAVKALGLDFAAVDVVFCGGTASVLEVNTAPGLEGTTLVKYVNAFREVMGASPLSAEAIEQSVASLTTEEEVAAPILPASVPSTVSTDTIAVRIPRSAIPALRSILQQIGS